MGCDIHMHIEIKVDDVWHHYSSPNVQRDYVMFALLANVRNNGNIVPYANARGLPDDMSLVTAMDMNVSYFHSHSWLEGKEICDVEKLWSKYLSSKGADLFENDFCWKYFGYIFGDGFELHPGEEPVPRDRIQSIRMVFAFDS